MATATSITGVNVEFLEFPATMTPPDSTKTYFLGGAGAFEKLIRGGKLLKTLDGREYVRKVSENCIAYMKSDGTYGDEEEKAIEKFREALKDQNFPPGASVFYKQSPSGTLGLRFSKDEIIPKHEYAVIDNKPLSEAVLETMIGEIPVSPALKESLAVKIDNFNIGN